MAMYTFDYHQYLSQRNLQNNNASREIAKRILRDSKCPEIIPTVVLIRTAVTAVAAIRAIVPAMVGVLLVISTVLEIAGLPLKTKNTSPQ